MVTTKDIFHNIGVFYDGIELNKIKALQDYGDFLCDVIDSEERHTTSLALHIGSKYYQAIAIAVSVIGCLFYKNTDVSELIDSLSSGDMLLVDREKVRFQGIKDGAQLGVGFIKGVSYFILERSKSISYLPINQAKDKNIVIYQGESENLGGKGVKSNLEIRKEFLSAYLKEKVSAEINHSIAIILDRDTAEQFYKDIYFFCNNKRIALSDIVTAAYYSDENCYQIGNNPTKEKPIIKFYSKLSTCRDSIIEDRQKRIMGALIFNDEIWADNNETHDIADRKGLKFVFLDGKTHYTRFMDWYELGEYKFYANVPETIQNLIEDIETSQKSQLLSKDLLTFLKREINEKYIECSVSSDTVYQIKNALLRIKRNCLDDDNKENFLMTSWFLLNLCRSAFFPLLYCDKAYERRIIDWTLDEKLESLKCYASIITIGESKDDIKYIVENISLMIAELYNSNPKWDAIKERIKGGNINCIVATKAYYEQLLALCMEDCQISSSVRVVTVSAFEKSKCIFENVIFSTPYYDFSFNPYACFGFASAEVLTYEYERIQSRNLKRGVEKGRKLMQEKDSIPYDIEIAQKEDKGDIIQESKEDATFENEMDKLAKDLLLKGAYRYISTANNAGDGTAKIKKIITFASGSVGYFTKYYKGYRICGEEVQEVDLDDLKIGDSMVFTKQSENKDIVDLLLNQLIEEQYKDTAYPEYYRLSICWKDELRKYMLDNNLTYQKLVEKLSKAGCTKRYVTIRSWLDRESHIVGPRDIEDYETIRQLVGLEDSAENIKKGCEEIRSLRMKILGLLGKAIINGMFTDNKDSLSKLIYEKAENLTQIEQITSINDSEINTSVPIYMVNKPCNA